MDYLKAKEYIIERLLNELSPTLYYHGVHHTLDVLNATEFLAKHEKVSGEQQLLLYTAALYHDAGFLKQYQNNEPIAALLVADVLPQFGYTPKQIGIVSNIILTTTIPQQPLTHLEKIMCDADLDYLGREDFFIVAQSLKKEWLTYGIINSEDQWNLLQIRFLEQHHYFTDTARQTRSAKKQAHLEYLKNNCAY
jgi:predicted metal-dependent HD superfamily phosphohydrolase